MHYAVEYAYGSHIINNGNRPDRVWMFRSRIARDIWVAEGPSDITASGYRAAIGSRSPLIRKWEPMLIDQRDA